MGTQFKIPAFCVLWGGLHCVLGWACLSTHNALGTVWFANGVVLMDLWTAPWFYWLWCYPEKLLCLQRSVWLTAQLSLDQSTQRHISTLLSFCFGNLYYFHVIFFFFFLPSPFLPDHHKDNGRQDNEETVYESGGTEDSNKRQQGQGWSGRFGLQQWFRFSNSIARKVWSSRVEDYFLIWCQITVFYHIINSFKLLSVWNYFF